MSCRSTEAELQSRHVLIFTVFLKQIGILIQRHETLPPHIHCLPLAMQPTLALRAAKHKGVIGLPRQSICQGNERQQNPGTKHPGLDTPA